MSKISKQEFGRLCNYMFFWLLTAFSSRLCAESQEM